MVLHLAPGLSWCCSPPSHGSLPKGRFTKGTGRTSLEARTLPSLLSQVEARKDPVDLANVFRVETFPVHDPPAALTPPSSVHKKVHMLTSHLSCMTVAWRMESSGLSSGENGGLEKGQVGWGGSSDGRALVERTESLSSICDTA